MLLSLRFSRLLNTTTPLCRVLVIVTAATTTASTALATTIVFSATPPQVSFHIVSNLDPHDSILVWLKGKKNDIEERGIYSAFSFIRGVTFLNAPCKQQIAQIENNILMLINVDSVDRGNATT